MPSGGNDVLLVQLIEEAMVGCGFSRSGDPYWFWRIRPPELKERVKVAWIRGLYLGLTEARLKPFCGQVLAARPLPAGTLIEKVDVAALLRRRGGSP